MSVIVMGMEMPKNCKQCLFSRYILGEYFCRTTTTLDEDGEEMWESVGRFGFIRRPDCCPLRSLPEKHGGLIDVDALKKTFRDAMDNCEGDFKRKEDAEEVRQWVELLCIDFDVQPTIVEAEEE